MKLSEKQDDIQFGHDYIPEWPSHPGTIIEMARSYNKIVAVKIEFYGGGKRWYGAKSFLRNFNHYPSCRRCWEIKNGENK